ncbi:MAG: 50S ribosomal protein L15 [Mariprofundales bacterium]|nr:50S ribosomal protein L15 [Mariprofundales bacterium]
MNLNDLHPSEGSRKVRKRLGNGLGSGQGKTGGRGHKGQKSRTGGKVARGFEGGQMPLIRRVPKRGFTPRNQERFQVINLLSLDRFDDGAALSAAELCQAGLVRSATSPIKLLGNGEVNKKFAITVAAASKSAVAKIEAAGGSLTVLEA